MLSPPSTSATIDTVDTHQLKIMMDLDKYQIKLRSLTQSIQVEGDVFEFNCIGMAEEAGEVMGKLKRALRGEGFDRNGYLLELGDVLGYLVLAAGAKEIEMKTVEKLITLSPCRSLEKTFAMVITDAKELYHAINHLLQTESTSSKTHITWLLSTILFSINCCALSANSNLEELMQINLQKLEDRLRRNGTLLGSGDNR